jgi:hypothetical protein
LLPGTRRRLIGYGAGMPPSDELASRPLRVFCSYSHDDFEFLEQLHRHLAGLVHTKRIEAWSDRNINAGDDWRSQISENLDQADVIVFLVSENFMASEYCIEVEYDRAIERAKEEGVRLIPLLIKPYDLDGFPIAKLELLPKRDGKLVAVEEWEPRGNAWKLVAEAIRKHAEGNRTRPLTKATPQQVKAKLRKVPEAGRVLGREKFLNTLAATLRAADGMPAVVTGIGGLGKSTVIAEFARRQATEFENIFWMRADKKADLDLDCLVMAEFLDLPATGQENAPREFRKWLEENSSWLLVLDNAVTPESIESYLPEPIRGQIVMTSRSVGIWSEIAVETPLTRIAMDDAIDLILEQTGSTDRDDAADLAALQQRIPLALQTAAAKIREKKLAISDYVAELRDKGERLKEDVPS